MLRDFSYFKHLFELIWCKAGPARAEASICRFTNNLFYYRAYTIKYLPTVIKLEPRKYQVKLVEKYKLV